MNALPRNDEAPNASLAINSAASGCKVVPQAFEYRMSDRSEVAASGFVLPAPEQRHDTRELRMNQQAGERTPVQQIPEVLTVLSRREITREEDDASLQSFFEPPERAGVVE